MQLNHLFPRHRNAEQGFSLVELMIVVAIIGVLAALAVPKFQRFQAKAKQAEAKSNLSHIYTLEQSYFGENDTYSTSTTTIGFSVVGNKIRYNYAIPTGNTTTFLATAAATLTTNIMSDCGATDAWQITDQKLLTATYDCTAH